MARNKYHILLSVFALFVLGVIMRPQTETMAAPEAISTAVRTSFDCIVCEEDFDPCESGYHFAYDSSLPNWQWGDGEHFDCRSGSCADAHGPNPCEAPGFVRVDLEHLRQALAANDLDAIDSLLSDHPAQIVLNFARSAVQVKGC